MVLKWEKQPLSLIILSPGFPYVNLFDNYKILSRRIKTLITSEALNPEALYSSFNVFMWSMPYIPQGINSTLQLSAKISLFKKVQRIHSSPSIGF
jgi:aspartyl/asparaginyl beta-hydroxylase (cupin superfamily)